MMKKIKIKKKLQLNKKTVVTLNNEALESVKGGRTIFETASVCATGLCICDFVSMETSCLPSVINPCESVGPFCIN